MATLTTGVPANGSSNGTETSTMAHSSIFNHSTTGQFKVLQWPPIGTYFHGKVGKLVPHGGFMATYESRGVRWTVGTCVQDETLFYRMKGVKQGSGGSPVDMQGTKASPLLKQVYGELWVNLLLVKKARHP